MTAKRQAPSAPVVIESFVKALVVSSKAVSLYPPSSSIPRDTARVAADLLSEALQQGSELRLAIGKEGLRYGGTLLFPEQLTYVTFARELYNRKLAEVRFHAGANDNDLVSFLNVLKYAPEEVEAAGGYESRLWDLGVSAITVTEAHVSLVEAADVDEDEIGRIATMSRVDIDDVLAAAYGGRSREQLTLARFMAGPPEAARYLTETHMAAVAGEDTDVGTRFAELAAVAHSVGGVEGSELAHSLGEALEQLDPSLRRDLLMNTVLVEARTSEPLAAVVRQMSVDSICQMIVDGIEEGNESREGLARAIRNLALISMADREEVVASAGAAMVGAGFSESEISEVMAAAAPSRIDIAGAAATTGKAEQPADAIFRLMDLAPAGNRVDAGEHADLEPLQDEARRGITDGDVIMALVTLVGLDSREAQFASTMTMLEDSLDLLIDRGELDIAADSADALAAAAENPALSSEQQLRVRGAISRFSKPADIRAVAHALRLYKPGSLEHQSARRLLDALGASAIGPLIEQLAEEPDMAVRKSMVDLLSEMALDYIPELGAYVSDPRWYVARNVVAVLGSTRSSAVLHYLSRSVRHPEPRVRREAIRALASIHDRLAHELLLAALEDDDAQNVRLAARYLGATGMKGAVAPLEQVARGDGRGNREAGPRVEAIEALGRLGAQEAVPTLQSIAGKRTFIGATRARELRAAAESALVAIRSRGEVGADGSGR